MSLDVYLHVVKPVEVHNTNITHNLGKMAKEAGIYEALWRPEEIGVQWAYELAPLLRDGIERLEAEPIFFQQFNPENGWGSYEGLLQAVKNLYAACMENPDANVSVWR